jgi:hypothetical protein
MQNAELIVGAIHESPEIEKLLGLLPEELFNYLLKDLTLDISEPRDNMKGRIRTNTVPTNMSGSRDIVKAYMIDIVLTTNILKSTTMQITKQPNHPLIICNSLRIAKMKQPTAIVMV